ncbi:hypothetical protein NC651_036589 [Populus alba x Populus x berolinensis]|nr:hypothetical protein NC651_036589 [Populus alba x Populus x berolinensis]
MKEDDTEHEIRNYVGAERFDKGYARSMKRRKENSKMSSPSPSSRCVVVVMLDWITLLILVKK